MKITCQSCQSKYTVSDEKVQGKTVKIKCRKCGATILVNSSGATTTAADAASAAGAEEAAADGGAYQINVAEGDQRTMSLQEIVQAYNSSVITADTYVWADGMGDWQPLGQVQAIVDALNAAAQGASAPQPAPEPARAAVKKDAARGGARDLFGSDGQSDVSTSAFSGFGGGSSRAAAAPVRIGAGKEEQSALFSLSALTNRAGTSSSSAASSLGSLGAMSSAPSKAMNTEDSGLIDLKALAAGAAAPPAASAAASLLGDSGGLFELAAPPVTAPTAAPIPTHEETKPQKNRTPLFIGLGALVAVGAIVGAFMVMKGGPPPEQPTANSTAPANTPPPLETAPPAPTPSVAETESPAASASVATNKAGTSKSGGGTSKSGGGTSKAGTAPTTGGGTAPATTAKTSPKPSSCGCAPGDLMCAMRCSAKGK